MIISHHCIILSCYIVFWILLWHCNVYSESTTRSKLGSLTKTRLLHELKEIKSQGLDLDRAFNKSDDYGIRLSPLPGNLLEWHFSMQGIDDSPYQEGIYHGIILLDSNYPQRAPQILITTISGRWELNKPICLSASAHHQETWDSNWTLKTLVMSLRNFMTTQPREIGSLQSTLDEKRFFARISRSYICARCGVMHSHMLDGSMKQSLRLNRLKSRKKVHSKVAGGKSLSTINKSKIPIQIIKTLISCCFIMIILNWIINIKS